MTNKPVDYEIFWKDEKLVYICSCFSEPMLAQRAISSAGSEHLPYKQGVGGSNPSSPTPD